MIAKVLDNMDFGNTDHREGVVGDIRFLHFFFVFSEET